MFINKCYEYAALSLQLQFIRTLVFYHVIDLRKGYKTYCCTGTCFVLGIVRSQTLLETFCATGLKNNIFDLES